MHRRMGMAEQWRSLPLRTRSAFLARGGHPYLILDICYYAFAYTEQDSWELLLIATAAVNLCSGPGNT